MSFRVETDMHRRRRSQNLGVGCMFGVVYRIGHGAEFGEDHQHRTS
jgi:hypothetical protein